MMRPSMDARANCWSSCRAVLLAAVVVFSSGVAAEARASEIYVVSGERGTVTFTSRRPRSGAKYAVMKSTPRAGSFSWYRGHRPGRWRTRAVPSAYDSTIQSMARLYRLEPALIKAVMHVESSFHPRARSHKGALGLMQLMPATARRFGVTNAYHPEQNIEGGVKYLQWLAQRYSGNERLTLAGYNAGEGAVDKYGGVPPYSETQQYVRRVLRMRDLYRCYDAKRGGCTGPVYVD
jgi:soluble lytic murein transglycosylase-like protein